MVLIVIDLSEVCAILLPFSQDFCILMSFTPLQSVSFRSFQTARFSSPELCFYRGLSMDLDTTTESMDDLSICKLLVCFSFRFARLVFFDIASSRVSSVCLNVARSLLLRQWISCCRRRQRQQLTDVQF